MNTPTAVVETAIHIVTSVVTGSTAPVGGEHNIVIQSCILYNLSVYYQLSKIKIQTLENVSNYSQVYPCSNKTFYHLNVLSIDHYIILYSGDRQSSFLGEHAPRPSWLNAHVHRALPPPPLFHK